VSRYLAARLGQALLVILSVTIITFGLLYLTGDPVRLMLPPEATAADVRAMRHALGLDAPLPLQYARFLVGIFAGRSGESLRYHAASLPLVLQRLPATFTLAFAATALAIASAIPLGVASAVRRDSPVDRLCILLGVFGQSMPVFWLGIVLILVFSVQLRLLPSFGYGTLDHLVLPAATLGLYSMARISRLTRSAMLEVLGRDYVRTARAKGLSRRVVLVKHALRNASVPIITVVAVEFGVLLGGAVITETVFAWPGVGRLAIQAVLARDFPLVQAIVFVIAATLVLLNLIVDLLYGVLDPTIRYA
jgi:peptide/nickel transport system permease protein